MTERATLADFNLVRAPARRTILPMGRLVEFTVPLIGPTSPEDWTHERITSSTVPYTFLTYSTCLSKGCFIVFRAFLVQDDPMSILEDLEPEEVPPPVRLTEMRLWQMIVDCWLAAGGTVESLRWVAFHHIVNNDVVNAMNEEFHRQRAESGQTIIMMSGGAGWHDNAFARCSSNVATALRVLDPVKKNIQVRAHLMFPPPEREGMHMIAELRREGQNWAAPVQEQGSTGLNGEHGASSGHEGPVTKAPLGGKPMTRKPMGKPMGKSSGRGVTKRHKIVGFRPSSHTRTTAGEELHIDVNIRFV